MQSHFAIPLSQHKVFLSSTVKKFITRNRGLAEEEPPIQIYRNEIHITNAETELQEWSPFEDNDFKRVFNELTKKANLYRVRSIDSLVLSLTSCEELKSGSMKYLRQKLSQHFSGIKSLAISFYGYSLIGVKGVEEIVNLISELKGLKSVKIQFVASPSVSDETVKLIIKTIHRAHRHLQNLHIDLSAGIETSDGHMRPTKSELFDRLSHCGSTYSYLMTQNPLLTSEGICQANSAITKYFPSLQSLTLNFSWSYLITDEICQDLGQKILERMESLKKLTLDFSRGSGRTANAMLLFNGPCKQKLITLEELTLDFGQLVIKDDELKLFSEGISTKFENLKRLVVNLMSGNGISDSGLKEFNTILTSNLKSLQSFTLGCFWEQGLTRQSVMDTTNIMCRNVKDLKELCLSFPKIDNEVLSVVSLDLENSSGKLEKLNLALQMGCIGEPLDLRRFGCTLNTALKNLKELKLNFNNCDLRDERIFTNLGESLQRLEKLKKLALRFTGVYEDTELDNGDFNITQLIPRNCTLEEFEIFLPKCLKITDEVVEEFGVELYQFQKKLNLLHINFSWCNRITEESVEGLCEGIKEEMKELSHLTLNLYLCPGISPDFMSEMKILLKDVPIVILYF